jgi:exodeoxyribonuclease V beta subunit
VSESVDLRCHGVLEAHAGTGKTYTIVGMVLRLLEEERLSLRQILLVTFTQKAAGELLERIREGIAQRAEKTSDPVLAARLRANLGEINDAWIGTIHGVSLRILRTWPFESGLPFRTELVDDAEGLERAAREVWRSNPWGLEAEDLEALGEGKGVGALMDRSLALASGRLDPDMVLLPAVTAEGLDFPTWRRNLRRLVSELDGNTGGLREADTQFLPWLGLRRDALAALDRTGFSKSLEGAVASALKGWGRVLAAATSRKSSDARGSTSAKEVRDLLGKKDRDLPQALLVERILQEVVERWRDLYAVLLQEKADLESRRKAMLDDRRALLLADWAARAADRWTALKRREGMLSYQDMLVSLRSALRDEGFRKTLRDRIRVGIVDEFQDTSALQWDIFRLWFLAGAPQGGPRLFLVGDPKQSIYSFQGGDVRTYLQAKRELVAAGAMVHELRTNWRSVPELLESVNALLTSRPWFGTSIAYTPAEQVRAPAREGGDPAPEALRHDPVLVASLEGSAGARRARYADLVAASILAWKGQEVNLPKGDAWKQHVLDWGDFAILVQTRTSVSAFRRAFRRAGIPWALYKEQGVFASRSARELRAVLAALCEPPGRNALKLRALLTRFFAVPLQDLDPDVHLASGHPDATFLDRLAHLASGARWSRLFQALQRESGIESRLLSEEDGDRQWMDLRQVVAHALEFLVLGQGGVPELVENLDRLARGDLRAAEDRNLHARATDRQRVQILTMHVSKGLEFPVVFLSPSSRSPSRGEPRWIEDHEGGPRLHMAAKEATDGLLAKTQADEELSRLLYVALTRPKLMAVLPLHRDGKGRPQDALSDILAAVEDRELPGLGVLSASRPPSGDGAGSEIVPSTPPLLRIDPSRLASLAIPSRVQVLSSYSAISRSQAAPGPEGRLARAEEPVQAGASPEETVVAVSHPQDLPDAWLPRGASTGDALHEILETLLRQSDLQWAKGSEIPSHVLDLASRALRSNGLDPSLAPRVSGLAARLLGSPMAVAGSRDPVVLCDLAPTDRRPELEFHAALDAHGDLRSGTGAEASGPGWLVGYIDLLFRHEGAWHVLDWKTTSLPSYEDSALEDGMRDHDYLLQASLYTHVLDRACPGRAGGAVYVFLRAVAADLDARSHLPGVWISPASAQDAANTRQRVAAWLQVRGTPIGSGVAS